MQTKKQYTDEFKKEAIRQTGNPTIPTLNVMRGLKRRDCIRIRSINTWPSMRTIQRWNLLHPILICKRMPGISLGFCFILSGTLL